jgi:hypothetical protein
MEPRQPQGKSNGLSSNVDGLSPRRPLYQAEPHHE